MLFTVVTPSPFPKPKSTNTHCIKKIRRKNGEDLLVITPAVVVAVGIYLDDFLESLGMVC